MVSDRTEEKDYERVKIEDGSYVAEITFVSSVFKTADLNGSEKEKLHIDYQLNDGEKKTLPYFVTAVISNAGEKSGSNGKSKFSNSKLYELLKASGTFSKYEGMKDTIFREELSAEEQNKIFVDFLSKVLIGKRAKILTKTVNPEKDDSYSVVERIVKFLDTEAEEEEEKVV